MDSKWARALAIKATAEIAAREWNQIVLPATEDPDPEVRRVATSVLARMEPDMTEPIGQMGTMERVLQLRRISLFADLVPDDLERLALLAEEVHFDDGEVMMREGEAGDRMFTILEGTVDVGLPGVAASHTIGAGEYVGILSAVTGGPRPASAYAVGDVSALSIASAALTNLILDRPEVARQMLVTVAQQLADVTAHIQAMSNDN